MKQIINIKNFVLLGLIALIGLVGVYLYNAYHAEDPPDWMADIKEEIRQMRDPMTHNTYDQGQCTYYVFDKVKADGNMIEKSWRDAEHWADRAEEDGYVVNNTPEEGALLQTDAGPIGHVAYIESINENGSINISEMNLHEAYEITERTIDADQLEDYQFIHPKENPHASE